MLSVLISVAVGLAVGLGLGLTGTMGYGWSSFFGVLAFGVAQFVSGRIIQKRVKGAMDAVQAVLVDGQKKLPAGRCVRPDQSRRCRRRSRATRRSS